MTALHTARSPATVSCTPAAAIFWFTQSLQVFFGLTVSGVLLYYYFNSELCWHNHCAMLNLIIMTLGC